MDKFKALIAEFKDFCKRYKRCAECPFCEYETASECIARFVFDKLTMGRTEPVTPAVEEKEEVSRLPEWCKAGAWLTSTPDGNPGVFFRVDDADEEFTVLVCEDGFKLVQSSSSIFADYRPLPFQMYSLQEAIKLIGQEMVVTGEGGEIIQKVSVDSMTGDVFINFLPAGYYRLKRPTINGIPFGTPGISADEIVERGARKNPLVGKMDGDLHGEHEL